jgi:outer membrane protein OmpA-like peptidoglycan-associated protein
MTIPESAKVFSIKSEPENEFQYWQNFSCEFVANGNEQFLIIGNFKPQTKTEYTIVNPPKTLRPGVNERVAYYYLDGFELFSNEKIESFQKEIPFLLKKLLFEFDSYAVNPEAEDELSLLAQFLLEHPDLALLIKGHADKVGSDEYNNKLSLQRAKSVKEYLSNYGISNTRIQVEGFGSQSSEGAGDELDRRVEFLLFNL